MTTAVSDPHTPASESTVPSSRLSRRKLLIRIGCGTLAGGLTVGGGLTWAFGPGGPLSHEARQLGALKNDPMGHETILGVKAVHTEESELPGWTTWKYPGVHLERWFQDPSKPAEQLRDEFIDYAKSHGWEEETRITTPTAWIAQHAHRKPDDYMQLFVGLSEDTTPKDSEVRITINYTLPVDPESSACFFPPHFTVETKKLFTTGSQHTSPSESFEFAQPHPTHPSFPHSRTSPTMTISSTGNHNTHPKKIGGSHCK